MMKTFNRLLTILALCVPLVATSANYADTFNRADAGSWGTFSDASQTYIGGTGHSIVSNRGRLTVPAPTEYAYTDAQAQTATDSMYAEVDLVAFNNAGGSFVFFLAISHPNDDSSSYAWGYDGTDLIISGSVTGELGRVAIASPVGKRIRVARTHSTGFLAVYIDGVLTLFATDSASPTGSGYRGIQIACVGDNASSYAEIDNFTYGDLTFAPLLKIQQMSATEPANDPDYYQKIPAMLARRYP